MTPRTVVVTGATGFTGPFVVANLRKRFPDAHLRCVVRTSSHRTAIARFGVEFAEADLRDRAALGRAFAGADTLVNVASLGFDWIDPLFAAIGDTGFERGVFVSTTAILTKIPAKSKPMRQRGEALVRALGLRWTIVRPTMIYGTPADRNIARLVKFVQRSPVIPLLAPHAVQQPIHVGDVADAVCASVAVPASFGREYNIAGRDPLTLRELVDTVVRALGVKRAIVPLPTGAVRAVIAGARRLGLPSFVSTEQIDRIHEDKAFSYADAARDLGFAPRSFEEGVTAEIRMMRGAAAGDLSHDG